MPPGAAGDQQDFRPIFANHSRLPKRNGTANGSQIVAAECLIHAAAVVDDSAANQCHHTPRRGQLIDWNSEDIL